MLAANPLSRCRISIPQRATKLSAITIMPVSGSVRKLTALPVDPRPSASLIAVNSRNEILLVQRNSQASSFGGHHVR